MRRMKTMMWVAGVALMWTSQALAVPVFVCETDEMCSEGQVCSENGACVFEDDDEAPCTSDADCGDGQACAIPTTVDPFGPCLPDAAECEEAKPERTAAVEGL